jgi:hypothetical protein
VIEDSEAKLEIVKLNFLSRIRFQANSPEVMISSNRRESIPTIRVRVGVGVGVTVGKRVWHKARVRVGVSLNYIDHDFFLFLLLSDLPLI